MESDDESVNESERTLNGDRPPNSEAIEAVNGTLREQTDIAIVHKNDVDEAENVRNRLLSPDDHKQGVVTMDSSESDPADTALEVESECGDDAKWKETATADVIEENEMNTGGPSEDTAMDEDIAVGPEHGVTAETVDIVEDDEPLSD